MAPRALKQHYFVNFELATSPHDRPRSSLPLAAHARARPRVCRHCPQVEGLQGDAARAASPPLASPRRAPRPHQRAERNGVLSQIQASLRATHAHSGRQVHRIAYIRSATTLHRRSQPCYTGCPLATRASSLPYTMGRQPANPREPTAEADARNSNLKKLERVRKGKLLSAKEKQVIARTLWPRGVQGKDGQELAICVPVREAVRELAVQGHEFSRNKVNNVKKHILANPQCAAAYLAMPNTRQPPVPRQYVMGASGFQALLQAMAVAQATGSAWDT